jgi:hypothetical protein
MSKLGEIAVAVRAAAAVVSDSIGIRLRRQLQNSKVLQIAVAVLVLGGVVTGSILLWQYSKTRRFNTVSVSGTLRMDGQPLSGFTVMFEPIGSTENPYPGPSSYGVTNSLGEFSLKTITNDEAGAVVGTHRVRLVKAKEGEQDLFSNPNVLPSQYNVSTTLTYLVPPEGTREALFDLTSEAEIPETEKSETE